MKRIFVVSLGLLLTGACRFQAYHPQPIAPAQTAERIEARSLQDSGLKRFIEKSLNGSVEWPPRIWNLRLLTLAALYFSPAIQTARAQAAAAQAGVVTAGMKPNPTLDFSPGVPNPYLITADFLFPVITHGKRRIQIKEAKDLSVAARLNLAQTAWTVRNGVRSALINELAAEHSLAVLHTRLAMREKRLTRLEGKLAAGEIARPVVATSRLNLINVQLAEQTAQGRVFQARAALAAAIGVPTAGLTGCHFGWKGFDQLPSVASLSPVRIKRAAVLNRLDVRMALAEYRAAEKALQLEIARQYPDFAIGPGYQYEEGNSYFAPSFGLQLPIFNKNQGPIAQAAALRKEAAANLVATQARVIAQSEQALAAYRAAYAQMKASQEALVNLREVQVPLARKSVAVGEADWLTLNAVELERSAASSVWLSEVFQAQSALGQLETAVERPLDKEDSAPLVVTTETGVAGGHAVAVNTVSSNKKGGRP